MKWRSSLLIVLIMAVTGGVVYGVYFVANSYLGNRDGHVAAVACTKTYALHKVTIHDNVVQPLATNAKLCDKLTIINNDSRLRLMAFGHHDDHQPYDGVTQKVLDDGQSLTITLNQLGTYTFHDHIEDEVAGSFTVANR